jgi:hypothetical protein
MLDYIKYASKLYLGFFIIIAIDMILEKLHPPGLINWWFDGTLTAYLIYCTISYISDKNKEK